MNLKVPTIFIIFGITGDLFKKKILEAIWNLYRKNLLPEKVQIYGFGRREWNNQDLQNYVKEVCIQQKINYTNEFINLFYFVKGNFDVLKDYKNLAEEIKNIDTEWNFFSNKLFYLATPPELYNNIVKKLYRAKLTETTKENESWTKVILEKPFGTNLKNARKLDKLLLRLFKEDQIYRVDHYLAKETVRNILAFRFSNTFLKPVWNKKYIEEIEIKIHETETVKNRGDFYDKVGALRDVGQNHILQLLALFTMKIPKDFTAENIRTKRAEALKNLKLFTPNVEDNAIRAQYSTYLKTTGVAKRSKTETFFRIKATFKKGAFQGVPVFIEAGKALKEDRTQIKVKFKTPDPALFNLQESYGNTLTYKLKPKEEITMSLLVKNPGYEFNVSKKRFSFDYKVKKQRHNYVQDYEQLLVDIIKGDQTLFVSTPEVIYQWKFVENILDKWKESKTAIVKYKEKTLPTQIQ